MIVYGKHSSQICSNFEVDGKDLIKILGMGILFFKA